MFVALLAKPVRLAVMFPAAKSPLASRVTIAEAVFASVAVVAELLTFPDVAMVANFVSAIAADALMSAFTMVPFAIFEEVTASLMIFTVVIASSEIIGAAALELVPAKSPPNCILPFTDAVASGVAATTLAST